MRSLLSHRNLEVASITHSLVYLALLAVWLAPGLHEAEFVFGMAHGVGWIAMSLACLVAVRLGTASLREASAVAILGGVGPFLGTAAFLTSRRRAARL